MWTPPRGVDPKPPPYRLILVILVVGLAIGIPAALLIGGEIDETKERTRERDEAALTAAQAKERNRLIRDQRPVRGTVTVPPGLTGTAAEDTLVAGLEVAVAKESHRRFLAKEVASDIKFQRGRCKRLPERRTGHLSLECLAVTSTVAGGEGGKVGYIGYPFVALVSLHDGRYAFCKTNPNPGEGASRFGTTPLISPDCSGRDPV